LIYPRDLHARFSAEAFFNPSVLKIIVGILASAETARFHAFRAWDEGVFLKLGEMVIEHDTGMIAVRAECLARGRWYRFFHDNNSLSFLLFALPCQEVSWISCVSSGDHYR